MSKKITFSFNQDRSTVSIDDKVVATFDSSILEYKSLARLAAYQLDCVENKGEPVNTMCLSYKNLLKKYIKHIGYHEGIDFIEGYDHECGIEFHPSDWAELERLAKDKS